MPKNIRSLGMAVKTKRGERRLRETALEIGIGSATLMRIENGYMPDIETYRKICLWMGVDPADFLGMKPAAVTPGKQTAAIVWAHLRAHRTPSQKTVAALAKMILLAAAMQPMARKE